MKVKMLLTRQGADAEQNFFRFEKNTVCEVPDNLAAEYLKRGVAVVTEEPVSRKTKPKKTKAGAK